MLNLEELGITKEELQDRVVDKIAAQLMVGVSVNDEGDAIGRPSGFHRKLEARIVEQVDASIAAFAAAHVLPNVAAYIEDLTLTETNRWGEKRGETLTFVEYLVQRAEAYMREEVNFDGKTKDEAGGYSWQKSQTRVVHLIHKHLHYSIENAMKQALETANNSIKGGLEQAVKIALENVQSSLKVMIETKAR